MKAILFTMAGAAFLLLLIWGPIPLATGEPYTYKPRSLNVRTTAYTHTESDHLVYGKKSALGTPLRFEQEYTSAAADWSRFPVGTEFRILGLNRNFVIDDYGSALVGKDTIDLYFPSKAKMNRWGARHVDIIVTRYGDFEKSREILEARRKHRHCRVMLEAILENRRETSGDEPNYEAVPEIPADLDRELLAAASIPESEWNDPAPEPSADPRVPDEPGEIQFAGTDTPRGADVGDGVIVRRIREYRDLIASHRGPDRIPASFSGTERANHAPFQRRAREFRQIHPLASGAGRIGRGD